MIVIDFAILAGPLFVAICCNIFIKLAKKYIERPTTLSEKIIFLITMALSPLWVPFAFPIYCICNFFDIIYDGI